MRNKAPKVLHFSLFVTTMALALIGDLFITAWWPTAMLGLTAITYLLHLRHDPNTIHTPHFITGTWLLCCLAWLYTGSPVRMLVALATVHATAPIITTSLGAALPGTLTLATLFFIISLGLKQALLPLLTVFTILLSLGTRGSRAGRHF